MARDLRDLLAHLQRLTERDLAAALAPELIMVALEAEGAAKTRATTRPRSRSGRLRQSIQGFYDADAFALVLRAGGRVRGQPVRYAKTQDIGATVTPKKGGKAKYLAIPLRAAKTGAGVPRYNTASNDPTPMHVRKSRKGSLLLFADDGGPPRYLLVKQSVVPPTRFLADSAEEMREAVPGALTRAFDRLLKPSG